NTGAFHPNRITMQFDECFGNRQAQTEASELPGHASVALFESIKNLWQQLRSNSDPRILDLHQHATIFSPCANMDPAALGREFCRILQDIPKNLLHPRRVGIDGGNPGVQSEGQLNSLFLNLRTT